MGTVGPGGGWIFFVDYNDEYPGFTYLEAAPADIPNNSWCDITNISLYGSPTAAQYWTLRGIGQGKTNTNTMDACIGAAPTQVHVYSTPTTSTGEWFLPSLSELRLMLNNLSNAGVGGVDYNNVYWSSTEVDNADAWAVFSDGTAAFNYKGDSLSVRAVRRF